MLAILLFAGPLLAETAQDAFNAGIWREENRNYLLALEKFRACLALDPGNVQALKEEGKCFYYLDQIKEALEAFDQYLVVKPDDPETRLFANYLWQQIYGSPSGKTIERADVPSINYGRRWLMIGVNYGNSGYSIYGFDNYRGYRISGDAGMTKTKGITEGIEGRYCLNSSWSVGAFIDFLVPTYFDTYVSQAATGVFYGPEIVVNSAKIFWLFEGLAGAGVGKLDLMANNAFSNRALDTLPYTPGYPASYYHTAWVYDSYAGSGWGGKVFVGTQLFFWHFFCPNLTIGYRVASVDNVTATNDRGETRNAGSLNYSGPFATLGFGFWL